MPFSVLHVSQPTDAGVARCVADLVRDQVARGWDVAVACPEDGDLAAWTRGAGAVHLRWDAEREVGPSLAGELVSLHRVLTAERPELVHLHSSKAGLAGRLLLRRRVPTVFQPNAWSFAAADGILGAAALRWERRAGGLAHVVVCVSEAERDEGIRRGVRADWAIVPNGVDTEALRPASPPEAADARKRLALPSAPLAVSVGRLSRQKGQDVLVGAWPEVRRRVPGAEVVLVGDGPERAALERRAGPGVRFAGRRGDVGDWLAACDVVVSPSRWEGLSFAVLEAMACGRSVVASEAHGMREAVGSDAGALVPVEHPAALAEAIARRLVDPDLRAREGEAGRRRAETLFDVRRVTERMARLYSTLVAAGSGAASRSPVSPDR